MCSSRMNDWPVANRPREKLLREGGTCLSDAELLAVLLGQGTPGFSAVELAQLLINRFGGMRGTLNAAQAELADIPGIGAAKTAVLFAARECSKRFLSERLKPGTTIGSPTDSCDFLLASLRDRPHEVFCCLFLDNRHRVLAFDELFRGTIDAAAVYPREIVKQALARNAAAVILAHNHPSGVAEPSQSDQLITRRVRDALELVDVRLLDHFVIGDNCCVSLASHGML
ncbi:MAG: DNA repair protein RadC [Gammaproteobacteria bacterium]|nr:DNA repair protein RadC [Gammaproteobacteria bacterium]MDP7093431.1 DNA repair protein RadC [Gammaproteobacteria bacterium]MDP7270227.1 DNA repair protein RadC [Gammaproteobacteria bacterium]HJP05162.1 DNA repair protein RadC [Gammaproteobacteria bacterium]